LAEDAAKSARNERRDASGLQQSGGQHLPQLGAGADWTVGGGSERRLRLAFQVQSLHGKVRRLSFSLAHLLRARLQDDASRRVLALDYIQLSGKKN